MRPPNQNSEPGLSPGLELRRGSRRWTVRECFRFWGMLANLWGLTGGLQGFRLRAKSSLTFSGFYGACEASSEGASNRLMVG